MAEVFPLNLEFPDASSQLHACKLLKLRYSNGQNTDPTSLQAPKPTSPNNSQRFKKLGPRAVAAICVSMDVPKSVSPNSSLPTCSNCVAAGVRKFATENSTQGTRRRRAIRSCRENSPAFGFLEIGSNTRLSYSHVNESGGQVTSTQLAIDQIERQLYLNPLSAPTITATRTPVPATATPTDRPKRARSLKNIDISTS